MRSNLDSKTGWVFLDAGDTFIYGYPTLYEAIQDCWSDCGAEVEHGRIKEAVREFQSAHPSSGQTSQDDFQAYFQALYRNVLQTLEYPGGLDNLENAVAYLWDEWRCGKRLRLFDDALAALRMLRNSGFSLGVVSNWDDSFQPVLTRLGVWDLFEIHIASCTVGVAKPDEAIFRFALNEAHAHAEECWFFGDQMEVDILPAASLGMRTALVDYYGKTNSEEAARADIHAPSLSLAAWRILRAGE